MDRGRPVVVTLLIAVVVGYPIHADAQRWSTASFSLSGDVYVDEPDGTVRRHLDQARANMAAGAWEDAILTLETLSDSHGGKLVSCSPRRYLPLRDACGILMATMPAEMLDRYRQRVDGAAERQLALAMETTNEDLLRDLISQSFLSSVGDDALFLLGEWELQRGDYSEARYSWAKIIAKAEWMRILEAMKPLVDDPASPPTLWEVIVPHQWRKAVGLDTEDAHSDCFLSYPDSAIDPAQVLASLVLVSILEGSTERAAIEQRALSRVYPQSSGRLAGREGNLAETTAAILQSSLSWATPQAPTDWPTFGGGPVRNAVAPDFLDVAGPAWMHSLGDPVLTGGANPTNYGYSQRQIAEEAGGLLAYHPVVVGNLILVAKEREILSFQLSNGQPAWGESPVIYRSEQTSATLAGRPASLGSPRYTLTVYGDKLYARIGRPETNESHEHVVPMGTRGYIVCLDLASQGKLLWESMTQDEAWSFEGTPIADESGVYVAMRQNEVRPRAHVACLDPRTGKIRWRTFVAAAETPGHGQVSEISHHLLTLVDGTLYYNTHLGAVAALSTRDGAVRWVASYQRAESHEETPVASVVYQSGGHFYRDLTPCLYYRGKVIVAPSDSETIFALDATSGAILWETHPGSANNVHLLGVGGGRLLASGDSLWWFDVETGKSLAVFPEGNVGPHGLGRGILSGEKVIWPTRNRLYIFDQQGALAEPPIDLVGRGDGVQGGNLLVADSRLIIATPTQLIVMTPFGDRPDAVTPPGADPPRPDGAGADRPGATQP
jgi:outer membrane protein assembly factor BamB